MTTREECIDKLAAELKDWSIQIDQFSNKAESAAADLKLKCAEEVSDLRVKQQAATEKMKELKEAGAEAWDVAAETADAVWQDLKVGVANVASRFG